MTQRTVLKVDLSCMKCKKKMLKAVSSLLGVDKIEADGVKGTLTVTGEADPYEIIVRAGKTGKRVEVVSIGPPGPPPNNPSKAPAVTTNEPNGKGSDCIPTATHNCPVCVRTPILQVVWFDEPAPSCTIL